MNHKQDTLYQLYLDVKQYCQEVLWLHHWDITITGVREIEDDRMAALVEHIDYTHYTCNIEFKNDIIFDDVIEKSFEDIFLLFLHECSHIFTGAWSTYILRERDNLCLNIGRTNHTMMYNAIVDCEEQMTNIIDKAIFRFVKETQKYKELNKRFIQINK